MKWVVGFVAVGGLVTLLVVTRGTPQVAAQSGEPDAAPLELTVTVVPGPPDAGPAPAPRPQAVQRVSPPVVPSEPPPKVRREDLPNGPARAERARDERREIWEAATRHELRKWFGPEDTTIVVGILSDMCQQQIELAKATMGGTTDQDARDYLDASRDQRHEVRDRIIKMSGGAMTLADFHALTFSDDFVEYCFGVKPEERDSKQ